jgi:phospholipid/cholesterol/gamma-HCH transport system substrate-binding protein
MRRSFLRRGLPAVALAMGVLLSGCEFEGAYDLPLPGSPVDEDNSYEVKAEFTDVMNVVPKSPVMVDDVTVGEVIEVDRIGWHAMLTMRIREDVELPDNAIADIRQTSLLGEKYVALEANPAEPSSGRLGDGDEILLAATGRNPEVEEVLAALSFLLSGGGVGQLATISDELNNVMTGRTENLKELLGTLDNVVGTLDAQKGDIIHALESMNNLAATLNAERQTIGDALDVMGPAIAVLADQHAELVSMLKALDELGVVGTRVIGASKDDILSMLRDLKPVLTQLNNAGASLPAGLSLLLSFPFPEKAREIVKGDYANAEIRMDIALENFLGPIDPGEVVNLLQKCLSSGSLTSTACKNFLQGGLNALLKLKDACKAPVLKNNPVCVAVNKVPSLPLPGLPELPGLGGLGGLTGMLTGATTGRTSSDLYGEALT